MELMTDNGRGIVFFSWLMGGCREEKDKLFLVVDSKRRKGTLLWQIKLFSDIRKKKFFPREWSKER